MLINWPTVGSSLSKALTELTLERLDLNKQILNGAIPEISVRKKLCLFKSNDSLLSFA